MAPLRRSGAGTAAGGRAAFRDCFKGRTLGPPGARMPGARASRDTGRWPAAPAPAETSPDPPRRRAVPHPIDPVAGSHRLRSAQADRAAAGTPRPWPAKRRRRAPGLASTREIAPARLRDSDAVRDGPVARCGVAIPPGPRPGQPPAPSGPAPPPSGRRCRRRTRQTRPSGAGTDHPAARGPAPSPGGVEAGSDAAWRPGSRVRPGGGRRPIRRRGGHRHRPEGGSAPTRRSRGPGARGPRGWCRRPGPRRRGQALPVAHKPETTNSIAPEVGWIGSATGRGRRTVAEGDGREVRAGGGQAEETVVGSGPWQVWRGLATVGRLSTGTKWTKQALGVGVLGKREAGGPRRRHRRARPRAI